MKGLMETIAGIAKVAGPIGAIIGALLYAGTLIGHLDDLFVEHLENSGFATQKSVEALDHKIDAILRRLDSMDKPARRR